MTFLYFNQTKYCSYDVGLNKVSFLSNLIVQANRPSHASNLTGMNGTKKRRSRKLNANFWQKNCWQQDFAVRSFSNQAVRKEFLRL